MVIPYANKNAPQAVQEAKRGAGPRCVNYRKMAASVAFRATAWPSARCKTSRFALQNRPFRVAKRPVSGCKTARFGKRNGGCRHPISARNQCTLPQNKSFFDACQCKICTTFHVKPSLASHYGNAPFSSYLPTNHGQLAIRGDFGTPTPAIFNISVPQKL